ncbi:MAG: branched-chain amino acid ABC transporter permease, partial [Pseudohongiellaceae bacterium]
GMALVLGSIVFVIVVIGGLGSLFGAFVASLLIGLLQSYAIASNVGMPDLLNWIGVSFDRDHPLNDIWTITLPQIAPLLPFLLLVLILIFKPNGLFGKRET